MHVARQRGRKLRRKELTEKMMENEEREKRGINIPNISDQNVRKE